MDFSFANLMGGMGLAITCVTALPFLAIAGFLFFFARRQSGQASASQKWPFVMGTIASSEVETRHSSGTHRSTSYFPRVRYEYDVQGHHYRSDRVSFGQVGYGDHALVQAIADRYLPGNQIRVYYNPNSPGDAVLEHTAPSSRILIYVAAGILAILLCTTLFAIVPLFFAMDIFNQVMRGIPK